MIAHFAATIVSDDYKETALCACGRTFWHVRSYGGYAGLRSATTQLRSHLARAAEGRPDDGEPMWDASERIRDVLVSMGEK